MAAKATYTTFLFLLTFYALLGFGPELDRDDLVVSIRVPKSVVPGQFETFILEISNDYDHPLDFAVSVDKPKNWHFLSMVDSVHLEPGEKKSVIFLLDIDRACEIGKKNLRFVFHDKHYQVRIEKMITTTVENIHEITTQAIRTPSHLIGGARFEVDFVVRNRGNCYENVRISSENGEVSVTELLMAPNSTEYVKVKQTVPDITQAGYVPSDIIVTTEYSDKPIRERVSLKVFPKTSRKTDPYERFPIDASIIYFGAKNTKPYQDSWQFEITGRGHVDRKKRHHINLIARGPSSFSIARVGNFDQYSLEYRWKQDRVTETTVRIGDFSYNLTPVTEMFRWARGVGVNHKMNKWEVGAFYNKPRFYSEVTNQFAAYGKYNINDHWQVQASGMQKQRAGDLPSAILGSLKNTFRANNHLAILEYSLGASGGVAGTAANVELVGRVKDLSYNSQNIYAGKDYPGYYTNSLFSTSNLRYRRKKWGANLSFSYNDANPAQDSIMTVSPYATTTMAGASYHFSKKLRLMLNYIYRAKEDRFPTKRFSYRENAVRYVLNYKDDNWNAILDGELAQTQNLLVSSEDNLGNTYNLRTRIDRGILPNLTIGGFSQYLYTNRYAEDLEAYLFYGGHISWNPKKHIRVRGSYRNNYLLEEYNSDRALLDFQVSANYRSHRISITTSHALVRNTVNRKDFFVNARYTYHLNAPISKKKGLYSLTGILKSKNQRDGGGVVVHIAGQSVMTDQYGRFVVNDLPPGIHYLYLDRGSMGVGLVTDVETPLEVEIFPKENNFVHIGIVRSGAITGKLNVIRNAKPADEDEKFPLKIVKATSGDRELLTYTDDHGNFSFKELLPGEWKIRVLEDKTTQSKWTVVNNNAKVHIRPSETEEVEFEVRGKERKIKFNQQSMDLKIKKD